MLLVGANDYRYRNFSAPYLFTNYRSLIVIYLIFPYQPDSMLLWHPALWFPTFSQSAHPPQSTRFLFVYFHSAHSLSVYSQSTRSQSARFSLLVFSLLVSVHSFSSVRLFSARLFTSVFTFYPYALRPIFVHIFILSSPSQSTIRLLVFVYLD